MKPQHSKQGIISILIKEMVKTRANEYYTHNYNKIFILYEDNIIKIEMW